MIFMQGICQVIASLDIQSLSKIELWIHDFYTC